MYYVKTKREKVGQCNICSKAKFLSWDHVPPKGGIELTTMEMENIFNVFAGNGDIKKIRESQNGLKYRTICKDCNEFLGQKYDHVVNEFALTVGSYLKSNLKFPEIIHHKTKPLRLMKGILGHLLAAKIEYNDVLLDTKVREFILHEKAVIPEPIYIFYWIYPYNRTIIMRDFAMPSVRGGFNDFGFFHTIKYFPIAYLVSDKPQYEGLFELTKFRNYDIDDEIDLPINLGRVEHYYWPEIIDRENLVIVGQSAINSVTALPKVEKSKS